MENVVKHSTVQPDQFGDMEYLPQNVAEFEDDRSDQGWVSLAAIIKMQQTYRKGNRAWWPKQGSDLGGLGSPGSVVDGAGLHIRHAEDMNGIVVDPLLQHSFDRTHTGTTASLHALSTRDSTGSIYNRTDTGKELTFAQAKEPDSRGSDMHSTMAEPYGQVFGKLPDPIRLHEQMGQFDGQVVFIGHPNRDISAHQWSSSSFQWVNIGRYAHSCGKVEGSLASDRLRGIDEPRDTLEYFKLAAENRETLIIQNGRPKDHSSIVALELYASTNVVVPKHNYADASIEASCIPASWQNESHSSLPAKVCNPFKKDALEDPFVAVDGASVTRSKKEDYMQSDLPGSTGSLDLTYRFPTNATTTSRSNVGASAFDRRSTQSQTLSLSSAPTLLEVAFGEEAASQRRVTSAGCERLQELLSSGPQKSFGNRSRGLSKVGASQPTLSVQDSVAQSTASLHSVARHALPTPSAASFTYVASKLNATAVPYARTEVAGTGSGVSESNASTVNAPAVGLHYSDPDGLRKSQRYEVTNGLGQQAPTRQSFKGPFFTETKPSTHDPTVALSVQIGEEEKLSNWFHDGQRPARQKEYTKSLIAAAAAASGRGQPFGAIGESLARQAGGAYANTGPFVRLYENLSEYVEEYGHGSGQSYFTRRWKPGGPHLGGMGHGDKTSYSYKEKTAPPLLRGARLRPSERMWG